MDKIKLLESQTRLLLLEKANRDKLLSQLVTLIAKEQGILEDELSRWQLNDTAEYFEKKIVKKNKND